MNISGPEVGVDVVDSHADQTDVILPADEAKESSNGLAVYVTIAAGTLAATGIMLAAGKKSEQAKQPVNKSGVLKQSVSKAAVRSGGNPYRQRPPEQAKRLFGKKK